MPLTLSLTHPGVEIVNVSRPSTVLSPYGICYILISASIGVPKVLTEITTIEEFDTLFGASSPSAKYIKSFFANRFSSAVRLVVYRVNPNVGVPPDDDPALPIQANWLAALTAIDPSLNPGGVIIAPEAFERNTLPERIALVSALSNFCSLASDSYWQSIADISPTVQNLTEAVTDKASYTSVEGGVAVYQPYYFNQDDDLVLPSAAMAAISLSIWSTGRYYDAPAGLQYTIKDCVRLGYTVANNELGKAHSESINIIRYFVNYGYVPYDCMTLSTSEEYIQIPSVICFKIVAYLLKTNLLNLVFGSLRGEAELIASVEALINSVLFACWQAGYLVGRSLEDAYTVSQIDISLPRPSEATLSYEVAVRPAYSIIKYKIYLSNLLAIPL